MGPKSSTDVFPCWLSSVSSPTTPESVSRETSIFREQHSNRFHRDSVLWALSQKVDWSKLLPSYTFWNSSCALTQEQANSLVTSAREQSISDGMISMRKKNYRSVLLN